MTGLSSGAIPRGHLEPWIRKGVRKRCVSFGATELSCVGGGYTLLSLSGVTRLVWGRGKIGLGALHYKVCAKGRYDCLVRGRWGDGSRVKSS